MLRDPRWPAQKSNSASSESNLKTRALSSTSAAAQQSLKGSTARVRRRRGIATALFGRLIKALGLSRFFRRQYRNMRRRVRRAQRALRLADERRAERADRRKRQLLAADGNSGLHALEPRMVFDAAAIATADDAADQANEQQSAAPDAGQSGNGDQASDLTEAAAGLPGAPARQEIAFVDSGVVNLSELLAGIDPAVEIVMIDPNQDGVGQIAAALAGRSDIDAIHILSHGEQGRLFLGNAILDADSMQGEHLDELSAIRSALAGDGDILIYGCDFTGGEAGLEAAIMLGSITGADIAASVDDTGHASLGGDWELETAVGDVETDSIEADNWQGLFAPLQVNDMTTGVTALDLAQEVVGDGVTIVSANFSGVQQQAATFSGGLDATTGAPNVVDFDTGVILTSGFATDFFGSNTSGSTSRNLTSGGDPDLDALNTSGQLTQDAAILEISFIPDQSEITMQYVFGSEEYSEFVYGGFNDTWAIFVNGVNIALAPNNLPLGIDTVNDAAQFNPGSGNDANDPNPGHNTTDGIFESAHESLYNNNAPGTGAFNTRADGFTVTMSVIANVIPNQVNTIRIAIADTADGSYDSYLLLRGDSLQTSPIARPDVVAPDPVTGTTIDVLANDDDPVVIAPGNQPLSITQINGSTANVGVPVILSSGATVTLNVDGTLHVTAPTNGASGDAFTYTIFDGANTSKGVVTIANTVNDAPVLTVPGAQTVNENSTTAISGFDLFDIDAGYETVTATLSVSNGTIDVTGFAGLTLTNNGTGTVTIDGPIVQIKNALNSILYTPNGGYSGSDTLSITVNDNGNTGTGGPLSDTETVAITVTDLSFVPEVNLDPPNNSGGADDRNYEATFSSAAGTPVNVTDAAIDITDSDDTTLATATISLLAVPDGNNERLIFNGTSFSLSTTQTQTVTVGGTTFQVAYNAGSRTFTITRNGGGNMPIADLESLFAATTYQNVAGTPTTSDRFLSFSVSDGTNTSNVAETVVNIRTDAPPTLDLDSSDNTTPPSASDDFESNNLTGGTGWKGGWTSNFTGGGNATDVTTPTDIGDRSLRLKDDGIQLSRSVDLTGAATATLSFDYRRAGLDNASDYVAIEVSDSATGTFVEIGRITGAGTDGSYLSFSADITPFISADTTIRFVTSGSLANNDSVYFDNIDVSTTSNSPTGHSDTFQPSTGPVGIASSNTLITDADSTNMLSATITLTNAESGDLLAVSGALPSGITATSYNATTGVMVLSGSASIADYQTAIEQIQFSSTSSTAGNRLIEFVVNDGGINSNTAISTINVLPNRPPVAADDAFGTTENATVAGNVISGAGTDTDPDGDTLTVTEVNGVAGNVGSAVAGSAGGNFTISSTGALSFDPGTAFDDLAAGETRTTTVVYRISDGQGGTDTATVTVTVTGTNDAPVSVALGDQSNNDADVVSVDVSGSFSDPDTNDTLTFSATGLPPGLTISNAGVISGTIAANASVSGPYSVTVTATDGTTPTSQTFTWTVGNPAPTAADDAFGDDRERDGLRQRHHRCTGTDTDPDGDTLTVTEVNGVAGNVGNAVAGSAGGNFTISFDGCVVVRSRHGVRRSRRGRDALDHRHGIVYRISDGQGGTDTATVTVTVTGTNDAPVSVALGDQSNNDADVVSVDLSRVRSQMSTPTIR